MTSEQIDQMRQRIVRIAAEAHAQYPQYDGYWAGPEWRVVKFNRRVRTKLGVAFEPGDRTIARPPQHRDEHDTSWTAYSLRNRINTGVYAKDFEEVTA